MSKEGVATPKVSNYHNDTVTVDKRHEQFVDALLAFLARGHKLSATTQATLQRLRAEEYQHGKHNEFIDKVLKQPGVLDRVLVIRRQMLIEMGGHPRAALTTWTSSSSSNVNPGSSLPPPDRISPSSITPSCSPNGKRQLCQSTDPVKARRQLDLSKS